MPHLDLTPLQGGAGLIMLALLAAFYLGFKAGQENRDADWRAECDRRRRMKI